MTDRELMQQALEALVLAQKDAQIAEADYAIIALRERLAQKEFAETYDQMMRDVHAGVSGAALKLAVAEIGRSME